IREQPLYTGGFVYGNRFANNILGLVISGSYNHVDYGSDNIEAEWNEDDGREFIESYEIRKYDVKRVRRSISGALDFKINSDNILYASAMYNWRDDWENRFKNKIDQIEPVLNGNDEVIGYKGRVERETKGGIDNSRNNMRRLEDQRMQNYALR